MRRCRPINQMVWAICWRIILAGFLIERADAERWIMVKMDRPFIE
jgi:hypothetical protein